MYLRFVHLVLVCLLSFDYASGEAVESAASSTPLDSTGQIVRKPAKHYTSTFPSERTKLNIVSDGVEYWLNSIPSKDFFAVSLRNSGGHICGVAYVSSHGTNRLDRSLLVGYEKSEGIEVQYTSSYYSKGLAKAILIMRDNQLIWKPLSIQNIEDPSRKAENQALGNHLVTTLGWFWGETMFKRALKPYVPLTSQIIDLCRAADTKLAAGTLEAKDLYLEP